MLEFRKFRKYLFPLILLLALYQCGSSIKKEKIKDISKTFTYDVTYQNWISDDEKVKGFDLLIPIKYNPESIELDSVYFKNMSTKLDVWYPKDGKIKYYVGRFYNSSNINQDTTILAKTYFKLIKEDQCIVTYLKDGMRQYKKLYHITDISHLPFYLTKD